MLVRGPATSGNGCAAGGAPRGTIARPLPSRGAMPGALDHYRRLSVTAVDNAVDSGRRPYNRMRRRRIIALAIVVFVVIAVVGAVLLTLAINRRPSRRPRRRHPLRPSSPCRWSGRC